MGVEVTATQTKEGRAVWRKENDRLQGTRVGGVLSRPRQWRCPVHPFQSHMLPTPGTSSLPSVGGESNGGWGIHREPYMLDPQRDKGEGTRAGKVPEGGQKRLRWHEAGESRALAPPPMELVHYWGCASGPQRCPCPLGERALRSTKNPGFSWGALGRRRVSRAQSLGGTHSQGCAKAGSVPGWGGGRGGEWTKWAWPHPGTVRALQLGLASLLSPGPAWFSKRGCFRILGHPCAPPLRWAGSFSTAWPSNQAHHPLAQV